ncbi:LOW QUALITY PROTEIN: organic cation transporter protein [Aphomia sociella]
MDKDHALEEMMGKLGDFGRYQCFQFFLHILAAMTAGMHMLSLVTVAAVPEHRCWIDGVDTQDSVAAWNSTQILAAIPQTASGGISNCYIYENNQTVACSKWVFDTKYRSSSRAIEWNLVCDKRWMGAIAQTVYMLGVFTGAVVLGGMADKYGRKIFCWSGVLQLIFGVLVAFIPEYWSFLVIRFLYGIFGSAGSYITGFVLTMEIVGPTKRTVCGVAFQGAFAGGIMIVAGWGALVDNRQILQVIYGLHSLLLIPHIWIMDESPRWLWAQGRVKESVDIIEKALKCNRSEHTLDKADLVSRGKVESSKGTNDAPSAGTMDLFKTPNLRNKTLNVCLCWFANSIAYYGLTLSTGKMEGNPYLITAIMGFVEIPSYAAVMYFLDLWGRRPLISSMMLVGGTACVAATFMPAGSTLSTGIVIAGKLFIAGSFAIIYNYSAELFPTVVRNSAMGLGSMCARLSGALTPLISLLDSFNPKIPAVIFGIVALVSGFLCFFLPETMNQPMPQTLADGENFGKGDTCFASCMGKKRRTYSEDKNAEAMVPLEDMTRKV